MRHQTVVTICEVEFQSTGREVPAQTYIMLDSDGRPVEIDLCEKHHRTLIATPAASAEKYGRKIPGARKPRKSSAPVRLINGRSRRAAATG